MTFEVMPEKVLFNDLYIYPLNVMSATQPAISQEVMERAVIDFCDKPMRFGEFDYKIQAGSRSTLRNPVSRHVTIEIEKASHIPRGVWIENGWLMANIEVRPRTPCGQELYKLLRDGYPARTKPEDQTTPFIFTPRFYLPNAKTPANFLVPEAAILITIDAIRNPYLKAKDAARMDSRPQGA